MKANIPVLLDVFSPQKCHYAYDNIYLRNNILSIVLSEYSIGLLVLPVAQMYA